MRILHVNKFLYRKGGAEAYMLDLAALQEADGDVVGFFGMEHPDNPDLPLAALFPSRVEFDPPPATVAGKARAVARMIHSPAAQRGMREAIDRFRPDVVHLHNVYHQLSPSVLRPLGRLGVASAMTLHDYKLVCPTYQLLADGQVCQDCIGGSFMPAIRRRCNGGSLGASVVSAVESTVHRQLGSWNRVDVFICPSRFLRDRIAEAGLFPGRLRHVNHFVELDGPAPDGPRGGVVFAGRLSPEKGVDTLIHAMAEPELRDQGARLTVLGDGPERPSLEALAARIAPGAVTFMGRVSKDVVLATVARAAVAAVPSRWHENQPMSVLEAFACGTPVVATTLGGLPELIDPRADGALVAPDEPGALAQALARYVRDPGWAAHRGQAGRARLAAQFSTHAHLNAVRDAYDGASRRRGLGPADLAPDANAPVEAMS